MAVKPDPVPNPGIAGGPNVPSDPQRPERPWIELAEGGIDISVVPGNHVTMMHAPHVEETAARLRERLLADGYPLGA